MKKALVFLVPWVVWFVCMFIPMFIAIFLGYDGLEVPIIFVLGAGFGWLLGMIVQLVLAEAFGFNNLDLE